MAKDEKISNPYPGLMGRIKGNELLKIKVNEPLILVIIQKATTIIHYVLMKKKQRNDVP